MNNFLDQLKQVLKTKSKESKPLYIKVKILPKSVKNEMMDQLEDGTYKIRIAAPAIQGKANKELCRFLKRELGVSDVIIVSGQKDRVKLLRITV